MAKAETMNEQQAIDQGFTVADRLYQQDELARAKQRAADIGGVVCTADWRSIYKFAVRVRPPLMSPRDRVLFAEHPVLLFICAPLFVVGFVAALIADPIRALRAAIVQRGNRP